VSLTAKRMMRPRWMFYAHCSETGTDLKNQEGITVLVLILVIIYLECFATISVRAGLRLRLWH